MEYPANPRNPLTAAAIQSLRDHGLLVLGEEGQPLPVLYCRGSGLRTDVVKSAQRAADATGSIQVIEYIGFEVKVQVAENPDVFEDTRHTWVLPDPTRRTAMLAQSPAVPNRVADGLVEKAGRLTDAINASNTHH